MKIFLATIIFVFVSITAVFFTLKSKEAVGDLPAFGDDRVNISSGSPLQFEDLTIPYLRTRDYKSSLGELEKISQEPNYTSYLTSYTSDGLKINGFLTIPSGKTADGGWPAVVFVHGYIPPSLYQTTEKYQDYVDYLARNGFVVFKIDLRGHGESEGEAGGAYYSGDYVMDVLNARAALESSNFVDGQKIGLWGHSMAGNVVFRAFTARPQIPAVVIWAGAVYSYEDLQKYGLFDNSYRPPGEGTQRQRRRQELFDKYGQFDKNSDFWKKVAAVNYLSDLKGAIQIHHATFDTVVDVGYSRDLMNLFDKTSVFHELFEYSGGGHNISGSSFNLAMQRTVEFFKKHLVQ